MPRRQHTLIHTLQKLSNPQQLPGVAKLTAKVKDGSLDWTNRAIVQLTGKGFSEHMVKSLAFGLQQPGALETYRKLATLKAKVARR